ncbi:MAG TPA: NBR1-Ig-like domain-containing protein, partial [Anaerolineales bacterium]|nr:NBR1-Ig-like domain-containing protein [Anaerolineales bacterium]
TPFVFNTQQPGLTPQSGLSFTATVGVYSTTTTKNGCNDGYLVSESQPYDGKTMSANIEFDKTWDFINTGTCAWDEGYTFAFVEEFSTAPLYTVPKNYIIPKAGPFTKPGETRTFKVTLRVPKDPGEYIWYYKIKDDAGQYFGSLVWVKVISVRE